MKSDDKQCVMEIISKYGVSALKDIILNYEDDRLDEGVLTIVSNFGMHPIPENFTFGELYIASNGSLDFSNIESVNRELDLIVVNLQKKLFERKWNKIYLIPFGHSVISLNIKMVVFRILRIETIDIFYFGEGKYGAIDRDTRRFLADNFPY